MSTTYGADVAQLRALAAQFEQTADLLERGRMAVGNAIQISAWVGPYAATFRLHWQAEHSQRIVTVAGGLRRNAQILRANADGQERASAVDQGPAWAPHVPGSAHAPAGPGFWDGAGEWWATAREYWGDYRAFVAPVSLATAVTGLGFLVTSVRDATSVNALGHALGFCETYRDLSAVKSAMNFGSTAGKVFGWVGVGLNAVDAVGSYAKGDYAGGAWSTFKAGLGVGALLAPPPADLVFAGVGAAVTIGEFAYKHREEIAAFANNVADTAQEVGSKVADVASDLAEDVGKVAGDFIDGLGKVAESLWPF